MDERRRELTDAEGEGIEGDDFGGRGIWRMASRLARKSDPKGLRFIGLTYSLSLSFSLSLCVCV